MVGRAFTLSLAGHAALIIAFLLLSATRHSARIAEIVRPIRLVASIELPRPAAVRARPSRPEGNAPAPAGAAAPRVEAAGIPARAIPLPTPVAVAVPKIVVPPPGPPAPPAPRPGPPPAAAGPSLGERLSRRLATASPAGTRSAEPAGPQIVALAPREPAPATGTGATAPSSAAQPAGSVVPVGLFPHAWYLTLLRDQVFARWSPPSQHYLGGRSPAALVAFRIDRDGRIERIAIKEGSGFARFDQSALAAVRGLGRAPVLPDQYPEETLDVIIRFQNE